MAGNVKTPEILTTTNPSRRAGRGAAIALATALTVGAVGGVGVYLSNRGQTPGTGEPPVPAATTPPGIETQPPIVSPTEKPTPSPTEKILTNAEKIEIARNAQQEALINGRILLPAPNIKGGNINQSNLIGGIEIDLFVSAPPNQEVIFPALLSGKIITVEKFSDSANIITINVGNIDLDILYPSTGQSLVKIGDTVSLGDSLFKVTNDPNSSIQGLFNSTRAKYGEPMGTIAIIGATDKSIQSANRFQQLTIDGNVIKDSNGKPLTISAIQK